MLPKPPTVLAGEGKHGFSDKHRGQFAVPTGKARKPVIVHLILIHSGLMLTTGNMLATATSQAPRQDLIFDDVPECVMSLLLQVTYLYWLLSLSERKR
jgi:hypothetical protein